MFRTSSLLGVLALLAPAATAQQFSFGPQQSYAATQADDTAGVDSGDLNEDGLRDIVTTAYGPERVDCWINDCSGGFYFAGAYPLPVGSQPGRLEMADFDGDGDDDVAVLLVALDQMMVIFNDGTGAFESSSLFNVTGSTPTDLAVADYDQDGDMDVIVSNGASDDATLFTNDGAGVFTGVSYAGYLWPIGVAFGDVDGDGDVDFCISNRDDCSVWIYTNDGQGVFTIRVKLPGDRLNYCVDLADFDGDGDDDVVVASTFSTTNLENTVRVRLYDQVADNWGTIYDYFLPGVAARKVVASDLDCDGDMDIAVSDLTTAQFDILENDGTGTNFVVAQSVASGLGITDMVADDLDMDGAPDLAASAADSDDMSVHLNKGCGLEVEVVGTCPGPADVTINGATPNGLVYVVFSKRAGCHTLGVRSPCPGVTLGLKPSIRPIGQLTADANGDVILVGQNVGPGLCGGYLQIIDATTCLVSNVVQL